MRFVEKAVKVDNEMFGFEMAKCVSYSKNRTRGDWKCGVRARAIYSWPLPLHKGQEMTQQEICDLSVADELPGISGSHFMCRKIYLSR